jgi:hypothetical protein
LFADPDYFLTGSFPAPASCTASPLSSCFAETRNFAWNHGNFQQDIVRTWLGMVGPGVQHEGVTNALFTDHSDVRPTVLSLAGLRDDYAHDGRVIFEVLDDRVLPHALRSHEETLHRLAVAYKSINAPVGPLGLGSLKFATAGIAAADPVYARTSRSIEELTSTRNEIAGAMIAILERAAFENAPVDEARAQRLIDAAEGLLQEVR